MKTRVLLFFALIISAFSMNVMAQTPTTDPFTYPARDGGKFTLTNKWLYSVATETYQNVSFPKEGALALSAAQGTVRGMALWNNKLIFGSRNDGVPAIIVMNAATGAVEKTLVLNTPGFEAIQNPCNFIVVDAAKNVLVCNVKLANTGTLQIWKINMETGEGTKLVDIGVGSILAADRLDAIGVLGDVTKSATIWSVASTSTEGSLNMYRWWVKDGKVSEEPDLILIDITTGFNGVTGMGTSPCVYPVADDMVYIDGSNAYPTLVSITGDEVEGYTAVAIDGFYDLGGATGVTNAIDVVTDPDNQLTMTTTHNGFAQFTLGGENFFIIPITAHAAYAAPYETTPNQAFRLYKYADESLKTREAEIYWTFPRNGFTSGTSKTSNWNNHFITPVAVTINGNVATIYVYIGEWGLASYELKFDDGVGIALPNKDSNLFAYSADKAIRFNENVTSAQIYSITGQLVSKVNNTSSVTISTPGIYVVKATASNGQTIVSKVVVK